MCPRCTAQHVTCNYPSRFEFVAIRLDEAKNVCKNSFVCSQQRTTIRNLGGISVFILLFYKSEEEEGKEGAESHHMPPPRVCYRIVQRPLFCNHLSLLYLSRKVDVSLALFVFFCTHRLVLGCRISPPMPLHLSHTAQDVKRAFYHIGA